MRLLALAVCALLAQPPTVLAQVDADEVNRNLQGGRPAAPAAPVQDQDRRNGHIRLQGGQGNLPPPVIARETIRLQEPVLLSVEGRGEVALSPDMAVIHAQLAVDGETAEAAITAGGRALTELVDLLRGEGIARQDIHATEMNLLPRLAAPAAGRSTDAAGFGANRTVTIDVRDLTRLDAVIERAAGAQGVTIPFVGIAGSIPSAARTEARRLAIADARVKAEIYAELAGAQLGAIVAIHEGAGSPPTEAGHPGTVPPDPAATAALRYITTVQVTWRLAN